MLSGCMGKLVTIIRISGPQSLHLFLLIPFPVLTIIVYTLQTQNKKVNVIILS